MATTIRAGGHVRTGLAGVFFVAGELAKRDWNVAVMLGNNPGYDLVATRDDTRVLIDVKARKTGNPHAFDLGAGGVHDDACDFIVCVALGDESEVPRYWIVPAQTAQERMNAYPTRCVIRKPAIKEFEGDWALLDEGW